MTKRSIPLRWLILPVLVISLVGMSNALMIEFTYLDLIEQSESVITGTITGVHSAWNSGHTNIETFVEIAVDETVHGKEVKNQITVVVDGGTAEGITERVEDQPVFLPDMKGQNVGLFLQPIPDSGQYRITGAFQGVAVLKDEGATKALGEDALDTFHKKVNAAAAGEVIPDETPEFEVSDIKVEVIMGEVENDDGLSIDETREIRSSELSGDEVNPSAVAPTKGSAGTHTQVVITGSGFGTKANRQSNADVAFTYNGGSQIAIWVTGWPYFNNNPNDLISWSDTRIVARVPTGYCSDGYPGSASSGYLWVLKDDNSVVGGHQPFEVTFGVGRGTGDYTIISPDKLWEWEGASPAVNYYINPGTVSGASTAIQTAAGTWNAVSLKSFQFNYAGNSPATTMTMNGKNEIMFANLGSSTIIGQARCWREAPTGYIIECDIQFNSAFVWSTHPDSTQMDIESIALHEMGHWLQLRDLYGNIAGYSQDTAKVMYGYSSLGNIKRALHADDEAGIRWLYPTTSKIDRIGLWRPSTQMWYLDYNNNGASDFKVKWGESTDIPVAGDWDGDNKDEIGLWRPSTRMWYLDYDSNGASDFRVTWGDSTDIPVAGDWDGDNKDEIGLWRPSTQMWYLDYDNNGASDFRVTWGESTDIPVAGDWDGDNKDEIGLWRPSTRMWYLDYDNNGASDFRVPWGDSTDIPVAGDWDGDNKDEIGLWRPSTRMWYLDYDNNGASDFRVTWGESTDKPVVGAWV
jgi:hypothetical protein